MLILTRAYVCLPAKLVWRNYALANLLETWRLGIGVRKTDATFRESYAVVPPVICLSIKYAGVLLGRSEWEHSIEITRADCMLTPSSYDV
jgi:hypothetical protein